MLGNCLLNLDTDLSETSEKIGKLQMLFVTRSPAIVKKTTTT